MSLFDVIAILLSLSALFSYINARFIGLPSSIAIMAFSLVFSIILLGLNHLGMSSVADWAEHLVGEADLGPTLLNGLLSFLLFAGAFHVNLDELADQKWLVALLATLGVVLTTFLVGGAMWYVLGWLGIPLPFIYCLLFGAVVAPTDPVAVMAILKSLDAPSSLTTKIAGESLFNDGVAVVMFIAILGIAQGQREASFDSIAMLFVHEAVGGVVLGLLLGLLGYHLLKHLDNYQVEVLVTVALVAGGYALASKLHTSGPLAVVVAGLMLGNHGREFAMSKKTEQQLDAFWEMVDEVLNAVLFLLVGLELLIITFEWHALVAGLAAVPLALLARYVAVGIPVLALKPFKQYKPNPIKALTWGGLKGGISVALALSLPLGEERSIILPMAYVVVVFSILVQGLTVKKVLGGGR
ncbi:cation:proton antiporter [Pseudomonas neustonica]|uniref:Sodium:proton antiporter n=1 Tax=Pseudomonas neustonica TaxID=2487346 RepID=A0ABX9XH40_9PSED|nr:MULTISPECIES: sodium:proton antiporter [Pseudomonas]MBA6421679.1 sodium:proton antiporter [Pseudomonas sp. 5Ae-yellow]ROZ82216.1 sodium:proton antiporter [Pseudomonas sp. SSM44]ROZ84052.1 sodium:proton antiporter [Pseudomonas neustonica]|tara:strand:- start:376 stop:1608 length:1233 start_codon:yes stop_codon:yes gene_type:complete